jgi:zinc transport system substrate-binding protein
MDEIGQSDKAVLKAREGADGRRSREGALTQMDGRQLAVPGALLFAALCVACARQPAAPLPPSHRVLCTTFPMFLFARNVARGVEDVTVDIMLPAALGCPHDYVLTPGDMQKIAGAGLLVANGLGLEEFLGQPVAKANPGIRVADASRGVAGVIWLADDRQHEGAARIPNPHMFASPLLAAEIVGNIARSLSEWYPAGAPVFTRNAEAYASRLRTLAAECRSAAAGLHSRRIVTEHAVFDYFARDCGLEIAAVVEEAPGQEPEAARMLALVALIRRTGASALFTEPQYPARVGRTIAREAGIPAAELDPVASGPDDAPLDHFERAMRANFETLSRTLK